MKWSPDKKVAKSTDDATHLGSKMATTPNQPAAAAVLAPCPNTVPCTVLNELLLKVDALQLKLPFFV